MRKIYLLATLIIMGSTVMAQLAPVRHKMKAVNSVTRASKPSITHSRSNGAGGNHSAAVIWSDDFSNPGNWDMQSESATSDTWVIDAVGPIGPYMIPAIASTSAANGWATFDSDNQCSGDQIGDL